MSITNDDILRFIENLSSSELAEFSEKVHSRLGLPLIPATFVSVTGTGHTMGPEVREDSWTVVLTGAGPNKIVVIKVLRDLFSYGLKQAKDMVENPPVTIREDISMYEAQALAQKFRDAGAVVEIR